MGNIVTNLVCLIASPRLILDREAGLAEIHKNVNPTQMAFYSGCNVLPKNRARSYGEGLAGYPRDELSQESVALAMRSCRIQQVAENIREAVFVRLNIT